MMDVSLIGQLKFDGNWVEIIIILLVIGGSVFGTISKKLIEVFSPKDSDKAQETSGDLADGPKQPVPPRPRVRPSHRVARPMPLPPRTSPPVPPPIVRPYSRSALPSEALHEATPLPTAQESSTTSISPAFETPERAASPWTESAPSRPVQPKPKRVERSTFVPPAGVSAPAAAEGRLGHLTSTIESTGGLDEVAVEKRLGHLQSTIADRGDELEESVEDRLGHVDPGFPAPRATAGKRATIPGIGRATPRSLRQAILLREILGPPVSLQPPGGSF